MTEPTPIGAYRSHRGTWIAFDKHGHTWPVSDDAAAALKQVPAFADLAKARGLKP